MSPTHKTILLVLGLTFAIRCIHTNAQPVTTPVPCTITNSDEVKQVLGLPIKPGSRAESWTVDGALRTECTFRAESEKFILFQVMTVTFPSVEAARNWMGIDHINSSPSHRIERGLGDEAYSWRHFERKSGYIIRRGRIVIEISYRTASGSNSIEASDEQFRNMREMALRASKRVQP
jgi:hypothetical protein